MWNGWIRGVDDLGKYVHVYMSIKNAGLILNLTVQIKNSANMFFLL